MTRLLAVADIHGAYDQLYRTLDRESPFDALVIGGDLTTRGTEGELVELFDRLKTYARPVFAVAGNMDFPSFDALLDSLGVGISGCGQMFGDIGFFGVSGSPLTPMHTPYEITEEEIAKLSAQGFQDVQAARVKVYVPHAPPYNTSVDRLWLGKHVGSRAVRSFIEQNSPDVVVCGHIHEARGTDRIGQTHVLNCGPLGKGQYAIVRINQHITLELKG